MCRRTGTIIWSTRQFGLSDGKSELPPLVLSQHPKQIGHRVLTKEGLVQHSDFSGKTIVAARHDTRCIARATIRHSHLGPRAITLGDGPFSDPIRMNLRIAVYLPKLWIRLHS